MYRTLIYLLDLPLIPSLAYRLACSTPGLQFSWNPNGERHEIREGLFEMKGCEMYNEHKDKRKKKHLTSPFLNKVLHSS
ncbi:hypothetical protein HanRHA438_Chr03g0102361 [Helianthus annuus]|nr:hypothetical protein HanIR_Chr12g0615571 [Helianthus annuus]KAJ0591713.1 hypothetical protein HanHA300_Chr03g0076451 [Helianthus annuus]KAJ0606642.1 hypothetical protein HanHA89_Chr03g0087461 [Helianthus annuus]KAJ0772598.1 hypothetical protein HanOQP8_Chr03g0089211 [Helianthus annuus]KAJ0933989.1 hypothetical protein HanRHA438_Chr03g0102361 [Helianthus annuus]